MKKIAITIIVVAAIGIGVVSGYLTEKNKLSNNEVNNVSMANNSSNNKSSDSSNISHNNQNNISANNQNNSNQMSKTVSIGNVVSQNNNSTSQSDLNISSDFTNNEIATLEKIGAAQKIDPGAGTNAPVINLNYYSVVNGQKYYMEYTNSIAGTNWMMADVPPSPDKSGNFSQLKFYGFTNASGQKITKSEFLNGQLSFDVSNPTNLTAQDKINMLKKIAAMYFNFGGYLNTESFNKVSKRGLETGTYTGSIDNGISMNNMNVNLNNTMTLDGQTLYAVEISPNEPFYISLTGFIYVGQEHYMSKPFRMVSMTNAQVKKYDVGI
ncbi:MAG: hypothetical protein ACRCWG_04060 [Sarcina sp.]